MTPTIGELVKFVLENRKGFAFKDYSEELIASGIIDAIKEGTLLYATEADNKLCGVVVFKEVNNPKILFVHDILASKDWVIKQFIIVAKQRWPDYTIKGVRKGKRLVTINFNRLQTLTT